MKKPSEIATAQRSADGTWTGEPEAVRAITEAIAKEKEKRRRWPQTREGYIDTLAAMTVLARSFRTLRDANGTDPWNLDAFLSWLCSDIPGSSAELAGRFLLSVWDPEANWADYALSKGFIDADARLRRFNVFDAAGAWDDAHRIAFMVWFESPFWP